MGPMILRREVLPPRQAACDGLSAARSSCEKLSEQENQEKVA